MRPRERAWLGPVETARQEGGKVGKQGGGPGLARTYLRHSTGAEDGCPFQPQSCRLPLSGNPWLMVLEKLPNDARISESVDMGS